MHACLLIPEIQQKIFKVIHADRYDWKFPPKITLASLARTCKQFHEQALDLLWERLPSFYPLVSVMPEGLFYKTFGRLPMRRELKLSLTEKDYERLYFYSSRICSLEISQTNDIGEDVLTTLSSHQALRNMLPRLSSLQLHLGCGGYYESKQLHQSIKCLPSILGESLRQLSITNSSAELHDENHAFLVHLLLSVTKSCPKITDISLSFSLGDLDGVPDDFSLCSFICSFAELQSLTLPITAMDPDLMSELGSRRRLRNLSLDSPTGEERPHLDHDDHLGGLTLNSLFSETGLQSISINCASTRDTQQLLNACPKTLKQVKVSKGDGQASFSELIIPVYQFDNMTSLTLDYEWFEFDESDDDLFGLFSLHALRQVFIHGPRSSAFTPDWIGEIPVAWLHLKELDIMPAFDYDPQIALEDIIPLSLHCRNLVSLSISADCQPFDISQLMFDRHVSNVEDLQFVISPLSRRCQWEVLRCILALFPMLRKAVGYQWAPNGMAEDEGHWKALNRMFNKMDISNREGDESGGESSDE